MALLAAAAASPAFGDVFHLKNGGHVEGVLVAEKDGKYQVRTLAGLVSIRKDDLERIEHKPSVLEEYEKRAANVADDAQAHVALAEWCRQVGYEVGYRQHMRRALSFDPDCAAARAALGYVKRDGRWVRAGKARGQEKAPATASSPTSQPQILELDDKGIRLVQEAQSRWAVMIRAIRHNKLESDIARLVNDGRRRILEIDDPLAVRPLMRVLAAGNVTCRRVLVEALAKFQTDEATTYLLTLALLDTDEEVRRTATRELVNRRDSRVLSELIRALEGDDRLVRHAAESLGMFGPAAREAVPQLIRQLTVQRTKPVSFTTPQYFVRFPAVFKLGLYVQLQGDSVRGINVSNTKTWGVKKGQWVYTYRASRTFFTGEFEKVYNAIAGPLPEEKVLRGPVTVYRTEVLEALKNITGQNFGFDRGAWERWWREYGDRDE